MHVGLCAGALVWLAAGAGSAPPLRLRAEIPLPAVQGRIDHFDADVPGHRVFMSALGNNTVEVFDTAAGKLTATLRGVRRPQGVTYAPRSHRLFVASAADGTCRIFDGRTLRLLKTIRFSSDADDTRYDAASNRVVVGYGEAGDAGLAILEFPFFGFSMRRGILGWKRRRKYLSSRPVTRTVMLPESELAAMR